MQLGLIVSPTEVLHARIFGKDTSPNSGRRVLHFRGVHDAHLLVPFFQAKQDCAAA